MNMEFDLQRTGNHTSYCSKEDFLGTNRLCIGQGMLADPLSIPYFIHIPGFNLNSGSPALLREYSLDTGDNVPAHSW